MSRLFSPSLFFLKSSKKEKKKKKKKEKEKEKEKLQKSSTV
jgi:hypothetical protein